MRIASLFSGLGGLDIGLAAGLTDAGLEVETTALVERGLERGGKLVIPALAPDDVYPRTVLERRFRGSALLDDVRTVSGDDLGIGYHDDDTLLCGGFPCQDVSLAKRDAQGLAGARSGLWSQQWRLIDETRPAWVVIENVAALRGRGLWKVAADLVSLGYCVQWDVLSARSVGAPHLRERLFVVGRRKDIPSTGGPWLTFRPRDTGDWDSAWPQPWSESEPRSPDVELDKARLQGLGNAVVPQVAAVVGRAIGSSERLYALDFVGELSSSDLKLPRAGCVASSTVYVLPPAAPTSRADARLPLPTPTASSYGSSGNGIKAGLATGQKASLSTLIRQGRIPTPMASEAEKSTAYRQKTRPDGTVYRWPSLSHLVREARRAEIEERMAQRQIHTPTASDWKTGGQGGDWTRQVRHALGGVPNPEFVEWLMGFPASWSDPRVWSTSTPKLVLYRGPLRRLPIGPDATVVVEDT